MSIVGYYTDQLCFYIAIKHITVKMATLFWSTHLFSSDINLANNLCLKSHPHYETFTYFIASRHLMAFYGIHSLCYFLTLRFYNVFVYFVFSSNYKYYNHVFIFLCIFVSNKPQQLQLMKNFLKTFEGVSCTSARKHEACIPAFLLFREDIKLICVGLWQ